MAARLSAANNESTRMTTETTPRRDPLAPLVDRFLSWHLPDSVCADIIASEPGPHAHGRSGTNLMNAIEAHAMLHHVLEGSLVQPKIAGYRQLSQEDADLMNAIKANGMELEKLCATVYLRAALQRKAATDASDETEAKRIARAEPERWLELARVDLQRGMMALTRAVAQPSGF